MSTKSEYVYVRLAPFAPRHGNKVQRYNCEGQTYIGGSNPHWYKVSREFAETKLRHLRQEPHNKLARDLFEIQDEGNKNEIQAEEYRRRLTQLGVMTPSQPVPHDFQPSREIDLSNTKAGGVITASDATSAEGRSAALAPTRGEDNSESGDDQPEKGASNARSRRRRRAE